MNNHSYLKIILTSLALLAAHARAQTNVPPTILLQPINVVTNSGAIASFKIKASGTGPLTCQWQCGWTNLTDGGGISGSATTNLIVNPVSGANAGWYDAVISDSLGSVTSSIVTLTVAAPNTATAPTITNQPQSLTVTNPVTATFTVGVAGTGPFTYQWLINNKIVSNNIITTLAGTGAAGFAGDGGPANAATLNHPTGVAVDAFGDVFVADQDNSRIREVSAAGAISTVAGTGAAGFGGDGGAATNAVLDDPAGIAVDGAGNLYIADTSNQRVRMVNTSGIITTLAGNGTSGSSGDGGAAAGAELNGPKGVAVDASGNVYIADSLNARIRKVDVYGNITTVAGNGTNAFAGDGGAATNASLNLPYSVAADALGNVYIADTGNQRIRMVNTNGIISTVAGNGYAGFSGEGGSATLAMLNAPAGVAVDACGQIFISGADSRVRRVNTLGYIRTVAGDGTSGYFTDGVNATNTEISQPSGLALDAHGGFLFADAGNNRVRQVTPQEATFTVPNVAPTNAGNYTVIVAGPGGTVTSSAAALTVALPPAISQQPASQSVVTGGAVGFSVIAAPTNNLGCQWQFNGTNLPGAVKSTYIINPVTLANGGPYQVVLTNPFGTVTSSVAMLTVETGPIITNQPSSRTVIAGGSGSFSVTAGGTPPLSYQWLFQNQNLAGQTNASLLLPVVNMANQGSYQVQILNSFGQATSILATLSVVSPKVSAVTTANGRLTLSFQTAPNVSSRLWMTTNLTPPTVWQSIYTNLAGTNGAWQFTDTNTAAYPVKFYQTTTP